MRDQELELIAALVEGRLEDETAARALIESSPEHWQEYEAQKVAYEALKAAETASLTDAERSALHRDVWTDLRPGSSVQPTRTPWYLRWAPVAAGFLVVVGLAAVLTQTSGGDSTEAAADLATTTVADAATEAAPVSTAAASDEAGDGELGDTSAEEEAETLSDDASGGDDATASRALYAEEAARIRKGDFSSERLHTFEESRSQEIESCLDDAGVGGQRIVATLTKSGEATTDTMPDSLVVAVIPEDSEISTASITFVDRGTCDVVYVDE